MKSYARDITMTLAIKLFLLFLLWWVCVRGMHPVLTSSQEWLLGKQEPAQSSHKIQEVSP